MRWLPEHDEEIAAPGELPPREQRLVLMRLASLFGPDAIAHSARATRHVADDNVRVVVGLQALTRAIAEVERLPDAGAHAGGGHELRRSHRNGPPERRSRLDRAPDTRVGLEDGGSQRLRLPADRARPGGAVDAGGNPGAARRRSVVARGCPADTAPPGRRGDDRYRDHRPAAGPGPPAELGRRRATRDAPARTVRSSGSTSRPIRKTASRRSEA